MDLKTELLNFVNWHNENNPEKYIANSEIGRYLMTERAKDERSHDAPAGGLSKHAVIKSVCDHPWQQWESVMGDGVLCRKCNTVIKQTVL